MELLTSNEMRQHERAAIEAGDVSGLELMERAGAGAVREAFSYWPALGLRRGRVLVLCGPGNNGGDGYVVARILAWRGWSVRLFAYGDPRQLPLDAAHNAARWREIGSIEAWDAERIAAVAAPDLVVDALFGIGLSRELPAEVASVLAFAATSTWTGSIPRWLAVDCPSGLDLDLGIFPGPGRQARADLSVTFHAPKPGHFFGLGPAACGDLRIVDIGLRPKPKPGAVLIGPAPGQVVAEGWAATHLPKIGGQGHKFTYGHTLVLSGGVGRGGAARLAARGALRAGAGLVTLFCPPAALPENAAGLDAIMLRSLPAPSELSDVVDDRVRTLCLGPGLGLEPAIKSLVEAALQLDRITVLDADALTVFTGTPEQLFEQTNPRCVLTPHEGEFARLFPDLSEALRNGAPRLESVQQAADRAGAVVLLKGAVTVVGAPGRAVHVHAALGSTAVPWLATAGAGDVLAGMIAGLAAASPACDLLRMTCFAVWLHAAVARHVGPGLIAEDLPDALPAVLRGLAK